jgi:HSP20 family molecular chaperone IbpA
MAEKTVAMADDASPVTTEETRTRDRHISPAVDIYETPEGLVLMADLPGVDQENLEIHSDNNILTIWGVSRPAVHGELVCREYELVNFFRRFELGEKIDQGKITAEFKHGVLTLNLPKAEAAKARQINVKVA